MPSNLCMHASLQSHAAEWARARSQPLPEVQEVENRNDPAWQVNTGWTKDDKTALVQFPSKIPDDVKLQFEERFKAL